MTVRASTHPEPPVAALAQRKAAALAVLGFLALAAMSAVQILLTAQSGPSSEPVAPQIAASVVVWIAWAVMAPGIVVLVRRFDFAPGTRIRSLLAHLVGLAVGHLLMATVMLATLRLLGVVPATGPLGTLWVEIVTGARISSSILAYATIAVLARAVHVLFALRTREIEATRLEAQAVRARLDALTARLQPHFLFNSLHTVGVLMEEDPARARAMLAELGDLLREVLRDDPSAEITLRDELTLLDRYLGIAQIRFADRLRVERHIAPEALDVLVPRFLLQPLVENALRHGLDRRTDAGLLKIDVTRQDGRLRVSVWNDGAPLPATVREGFGLSATRERLAQQYGAAASVSLRSLDHGVEAVVELPATERLATARARSMATDAGEMTVA